MDQELIKLFGAGGVIIGLVITALKFGVSYGFKCIEKLYTDMTLNHDKQLQQLQDDKKMLMEFLNKKNDTDAKIALTLDNVANKLECLNNRVEEIEKSLERGG